MSTSRNRYGQLTRSPVLTTYDVIMCMHTSAFHACTQSVICFFKELKGHIFTDKSHPVTNFSRQYPKRAHKIMRNRRFQIA